MVRASIIAIIIKPSSSMKILHKLVFRFTREERSSFDIIQCQIQIWLQLNPFFALNLLCEVCQTDTSSLTHFSTTKYCFVSWECNKNTFKRLWNWYLGKMDHTRTLKRYKTDTQIWSSFLPLNAWLTTQACINWKGPMLNESQSLRNLPML